MLRKHQRMKRIIYIFLKELSTKISYRYTELHIWTKISIFWISLSSIALFLPWIESLDAISILPSWNMSENAFSIFSGYIWYFLFALFAFVLFSMISKRRKERLKYFSLIDTPESVLVLFTGMIVCMISLQYFFIVGWYQVMSQNIMYWKGLILSTTWSLLMFIWYYFLRNSRKKQGSGSFGYEKSQDIFEKHPHNPDNMKLPF